MILHPIQPKGTHLAWASQYLAYVQPFNTQSRGAIDPVTHMHVLKCSRWSGGIARGEILSLDQIHSYVHIIQKFGKQADSRLTLANILHFADTFYLNHYYDKEFF